LAAAAGNVINDIFDIEIDRINRPERVLVKGDLTKKSAANYYYGLVIGSLISAAIAGLASFAIISGIHLLLFIYSKHLKRRVLVGNICVSFLTASAFLYAGILCGKIGVAFTFSVFAFLITLAREIIKDIADIEGDKALGLNTLPITSGKKAARNVAVMISGLLGLSMYPPVYFHIVNEKFAIMAVTLLIPLIVISVLLLYTKEWEKRLRLVSHIQKAIIIIGLFAIAIGYHRI
jgi:geranylgeranylglycerol-phosphate geranylgeranyltransferase